MVLSALTWLQFEHSAVVSGFKIQWRTQWLLKLELGILPKMQGGPLGHPNVVPLFPHV